MGVVAAFFGAVAVVTAYLWARAEMRLETALYECHDARYDRDKYQRELLAVQRAHRRLRDDVTAALEGRLDDELPRMQPAPYPLDD